MAAYNVKIDHFSVLLPERIVGNEEIFALVRKKKQELGLEIDETRLDWRAFGATTMIQDRRIFPEGSDIHKISEETLTKALLEAGWKADELDFIIVSTISKSPYVGAVSTPSIACKVQEAVRAWNAFAYDSSAACSGWLYAAQQATAFIHSKMAKKGAVICIDMPHNGGCVDFSNEKTAPLTGEVSTATLFSYSEEPRIYDVKTQANKPDIKSDIITVGVFAPPNLPQLPFSLNGKLVYKLGIQEMLRMTKENESYAIEKL